MAMQVCLSECPHTYWAWPEQSLRESASSDHSGRSSMICKYNVDPLTSSKVGRSSLTLGYTATSETFVYFFNNTYYNDKYNN